MALASRSAPQTGVHAIRYAIASGKGGVGKTWFSVTLASAFAQSDTRALLVDCDLGLANVDVQLGLRAKSDLTAVARGWIDLDASVAPVFGGASRPGGFDMLPGQSAAGALASVKTSEIDRINKGLDLVSSRYDAIILDLSAGIDATTLRFANSAHRTIIVTTEDPTAMTDAYAMIKIMRLNGATQPPWIVVNMADTRASGRRVFDQLAKACIGHLSVTPSLAGVICRDLCVSDAIRAQTAISVRHPKAQALEDVIKIAAALRT
jgi:flagellar biosynthesis protein FlhG